MKITLTSALLCLAASSALADKKVANPQKLDSDAVDHRHHEINPTVMAQYRPLGVMRHENQHDNEEEDDGKDHSHHRKDDRKKMKDDNEKEENMKGGEGKGDKKDTTNKKGGDSDVKDEKKSAKTGAEISPALADGSSMTTTIPGTVTIPTTGKITNAAPLWLVQPIGASVWEQGQTYVISWGPNPDPNFPKGFDPKTPINVSLMQGPPDSLHEVAMLMPAMDSSLNFLQWTVPATMVPGTDYSIRLSHEADLDTYSHYFEVVMMGDPRSSKSNVGEPLQMPLWTGDVPPKGAKPAAPPNPFPVDKKTEAPKPVVTKPSVHSSGNLGIPVEYRQGANIMALAMALFSAVYFL